MSVVILSVLIKTDAQGDIQMDNVDNIIDIKAAINKVIPH